MTPSQRIAACLLVPLVAITSPAQAAVRTYMAVAGLPGESLAVGHANEIELKSYSQTIGTRNCSRVIAVKSIDSTSPGLVSRAAGNVVIPQVIIKMDKVNIDATSEFFRVTLDQVLIERMELVGDDAGALSLTERVVLAPRSITLSYRPQLSNGSLGTPIVSTVACP